MGILKKLIGLFFLILIFFLLLKSKTLLSMLNNFTLGPTKTPTQIGIGYSTEAVSIGVFKATGTNSSFGAATISQNGRDLILTIENIKAFEGNWAFWLSNTPTITNETKYIDFGPVTAPYSFKEYKVEVKGSVDLTAFRYLMIINPETFDIYAVSVLHK